MAYSRVQDYQQIGTPFLAEDTRLHFEKKTKNLERSDVKREIYKRECARCHVVPVSAYLRAPSSGSLVIRHYNLGPNGAKALSAPLMLDDTVTHVDIVGNAIGVEGLVFLLQAIAENRSVRHLDISDNNLASTGAKVLGDFIRQSKNTTLEHLVMSENCFKDEDGLFFSEAIKVNKSLKEIVLSHNLFGDVSGPAFGKALAINNTLETFDISWNQIRKKSAALFVKRLKDNIGLTRLNLGFNGLGSEGASEMVSLLKTNKRLVELDLSHNRLKDLDSVPLAKGLAKNDTLKVLRIGDNLLTSVGATAILHSLYDPLSLCALETLDFHNTSVDLPFERYLKEIKVNRDIHVIHGKVMMVGDPPLPTKTYIRVKTRDKNNTVDARNKPKVTSGTNTMTTRP
ncbi:leucine-rich repeat-containing protein 74A-like isoform X2 [Pecten maximus]|uniref:leucine-rich repeat-containing protein 74A-like isoform X2 n=1 Tax=Pecten maximus TaxID=6579 RepID=UPI0014581FF7|nr:leucine-rich repeat-containing protein 74A-like isoform X2 [Pecten maximus]XP_033734775.1 leucine-rich repeat-containing protein 74A-like isoform X2 [Pecten maximus]